MRILIGLPKALAVQREVPKATVIGSDQVCAVAGEILGKPGNEAANRLQLGMLAGRTHELLTALVVLSPKGRHEHMEVAALTMGSLTNAAIARYVAKDQAYDCAGGYKLECAGIGLFDKIETGDHTAIEGLPLLATARILRQLGVKIP